MDSTGIHTGGMDTGISGHTILLTDMDTWYIHLTDMDLCQHIGLCLITDHKVDSTGLLYTITDHKVDSTDHHKDIMELRTTVKEDLEEEDEKKRDICLSLLV